MKRVVLLLLCAFLAASLCLHAGALSFADTDSIRNLDAVTMMANLGLANGYEDGTFLPRNNIRRAEAAKLAALICEETPKASGSVGFSDVKSSSWAANFIAYCAEKSIIVGANGRFRPDDYVTGREFAKMMLACIGHDGGAYVGSSWAAKVDADAKKLGIYAGFTADPASLLSRDDACLLMYNAMQCYAVTSKDEKGQPVYALDELMNPMTYMEYRFGVMKYAGVLEANEFSDLTQTGGKLETGKSRLKGHAAFDVTTPYGFLGRMVEIYAVRITVGAANYYRVIGVPRLTDTETAFTVASEENYLMALRYAGISTGTATEFYYNGDAVGEDFLVLLGDDCVITAVDRNGDKILDAVLATDYVNGTVKSVMPLTISCADTTLPGDWFSEETALKVGDTVRCAAIGNVFWIENGKEFD